MCASSWAITEDNCSSFNPVKVQIGNITTGRNHPATAGASSLTHSQKLTTRFTPTFSCRILHIANNSSLTGFASLRRNRSTTNTPPAERKLNPITPTNQISTSHIKYGGIELRDRLR